MVPTLVSPLFPHRLHMKFPFNIPLPLTHSFKLTLHSLLPFPGSVFLLYYVSLSSCSPHYFSPNFKAPFPYPGCMRTHCVPSHFSQSGCILRSCTLGKEGLKLPSLISLSSSLWADHLVDTS